MICHSPGKGIHRLKGCKKAFPCFIQGFSFFLGLGNKVTAAGKDSADRADTVRHTADRIQDAEHIVCEDDIAVLSHEFYDQILSTEIAVLVRMLKGKPKDPLRTRLGDTFQPCSCQMLSQQHGKGRRLFRRGARDPYQ